MFFATTINYIDRQVSGILATDDVFKAQIGWNEVEYGFVNTAFQAAYAIGLLGVGGLTDKFGKRKGFSFAIVFWSIASMGHSLARSAFGFGVARFTLGLGEAGNFPAAIKTVAEWFPKKERAFATGIFNSGSNAGADCVKIFPCDVMGGAKYLKTLKTLSPHIEMMPTGGVSCDTIADFFNARAIAVGVGADLVDFKAMRQGNLEIVAEKSSQIFGNRAESLRVRRALF